MEAKKHPRGSKKGKDEATSPPADSSSEAYPSSGDEREDEEEKREAEKAEKAEEEQEEKDDEDDEVERETPPESPNEAAGQKPEAQPVTSI
jgi:hypothetical protein